MSKNRRNQALARRSISANAAKKFWSKQLHEIHMTARAQDSAMARHSDVASKLWPSQDRDTVKVLE